jgi:C4-dicarboxylate-specific signal transduction histidine kinase
MSVVGPDSHLSENDVTAAATLAPGQPPVSGRVHLKQVLMNLIVSAVEAMATVTDRPRTLHVVSRHHAGGRGGVGGGSGPGTAPIRQSNVSLSRFPSEI